VRNERRSGGALGLDWASSANPIIFHIYKLYRADRTALPILGALRGQSILTTPRTATCVMFDHVSIPKQYPLSLNVATRIHYAPTVTICPTHLGNGESHRARCIMAGSPYSERCVASLATLTTLALPDSRLHSSVGTRILLEVAWFPSPQ
jgi:hypothetical protein